MPRPVKEPTFFEIQQTLATALRRTAVNPSIAGYKPQIHQTPFHQSQKIGRLFLGGNRAGKTVSGGTESVMWLTGRHLYWQKFKPPIRGRGIAVDFDNGVKKTLLPEIARWMPPSMLINGSWEDSFEKSTRTLTLSNDSTMEFMSYDQDVDKFSGTSRHFVWFDEEPPEDIFNENMLRLVDVGGHWWMTMTPILDMSWTYDRLYHAGRSGSNKNIEVFEAETSDNVFVNDAILDILVEGMSDEEKKARKAGKYYSKTGTIYGHALSPGVFLDPFIDTDKWPLLQSGAWAHFGMLDHGYTNPTAFLLGCYDREGRVIIYDEYYRNKLLVHENATNIKARLKELRIVPEYIIADPSIVAKNAINGTSIHAEYAEFGVNLGLANNDVIGGINRVASRLKNKQLFITKNCEKLIWELERYRWASWSNAKVAVKNNLYETPMKKDDHAVDALRYGIVSRYRHRCSLWQKLGLRVERTANTGGPCDFVGIVAVGEPFC